MTNWRENLIHDGALEADLTIPINTGRMILPVGTRLRVVALIQEGIAQGGPGICYQPPDIVVDYRITLVAESMIVKSGASDG